MFSATFCAACRRRYFRITLTSGPGTTPRYPPTIDNSIPTPALYRRPRQRPDASRGCMHRRKRTDCGTRRQFLPLSSHGCLFSAVHSLTHRARRAAQCRRTSVISAWLHCPERQPFSQAATNDPEPVLPILACTQAGSCLVAPHAKANVGNRFPVRCSFRASKPPDCTFQLKRPRLKGPLLPTNGLQVAHSRPRAPHLPALRSKAEQGR